MADNRSTSNHPKRDTRPVKADPGDVLIPAGDAVGREPQKRELPKTTRREVRKLSKQLGAAQAMEAKRLRQSVKAHQKVDKRERQVARAAASVAKIEGRIRDVASGASAASPAPAATPTPPARAGRPRRAAGSKPKPAAKPKPTAGA